MERRDYSCPEYKKWRLAVKKRDRFKCVLCGSKRRLVVHHIRRWADAPELRFVVTNGVTLCKLCHDHRVNEHEQMFEDTFARIAGGISQDVKLKILLLSKR